MTLITGFRCKDGVVLGADTEMTAVWSYKFMESKIRFATRQVSRPFFFAYADDPVFSEMCMSRLAASIVDAEKKEKADIYEIVRKECLAIRHEYRKERKHLHLIWSIMIEGRYQLFHIQDGVVAPTKKAIEGGGAVIANPLASRFYSKLMGLDEAQFMTAYILWSAKSHGFGVGGKSQIFLLQDRHGWKEMHYPEIEDLEKAYQRLHDCLVPLVLSYGKWNDANAPFNFAFTEFCKEIKSYREFMNEEYEKRRQQGEEG